MDLTLEDVSELINVSKQTVKSWASEGEIPGYRINDQYRFNRTEIEDWVLKQQREEGKVSSTPYGSFSSEDERTTVKSGITQFSLYRAIHRGHVLHEVPGTAKEELIRAAMSSMAQDLDLDADVLTDLLLDRERLMPTALNNGIAVPHTRDFLLEEHFDVVTVVFPKEPIEYGALDGQPVHSLFFLFACEDKRHLSLLAKLAHLASQPEALDLLRTQPSKRVLLEYIKEWETQLSRTQRS